MDRVTATLCIFFLVLLQPFDIFAATANIFVLAASLPASHTAFSCRRTTNAATIRSATTAAAAFGIAKRSRSLGASLLTNAPRRPIRTKTTLSSPPPSLLLRMSNHNDSRNGSSRRYSQQGRNTKQQTASILKSKSTMATTRHSNKNTFLSATTTTTLSGRGSPSDTTNAADTTTTNRNAALDSIVKVYCTHSEPDHILPWQKLAQCMSTSTGFIINTSLLQQETSNEDDVVSNDNCNGEDFDAKQHLRILTNAHSVEYGSIIQVQRRGDETKYEAYIENFCNECDLAILRIIDDDGENEDDTKQKNGFWNSPITPLQFGTALPDLQDDVEVIGYPTGGESLSITQGVVSRIEMQVYTQSTSALLAIQIDAAINSGNSGGPVVNKDTREVVGVAFQGLSNAENIGYVIPITIVQHVLKNISANDGKYTGFCTLGFRTMHLENKAYRRSLGMMKAPPPIPALSTATHDEDTTDSALFKNTQQHEMTGVLVNSILPLSASKDVLQENDVIMALDGDQVSNDGKIPFRHGERVAMTCYLNTKSVGDSVQLQVLRDSSSVLNLDVPVGIYKSSVPSHWDNQFPPYYIVGGLVFTVLSIPYLEASGAWGGEHDEQYVSNNLSHLMRLQHTTPLLCDTDEIVILIQVLAHRENLGYDMLCDLHLQKVDGVPVRSLRHLQSLVEGGTDDDATANSNSSNDNDAASNEFIRFEFEPSNQVIVMERCKLKSVTDEVCEEHSIRRPYYFRENDEEEEEEEIAEETEIVVEEVEIAEHIEI